MIMKLEKDNEPNAADSRKPESHEAVVSARETYEALLRDFLRNQPQTSKVLIRKGEGKNSRLTVVSDRSPSSRLPVGLKEAQAALINTYNHVAVGGGRVSHHDLATDPSEQSLHHDEPHHEEHHEAHHGEHDTPGHAYCRKVEEDILHAEHEQQRTRLYELRKKLKLQESKTGFTLGHSDPHHKHHHN